MRVLFRRFLVLTALLFWQGGFLFYSSVVVPIGQRDLGSVEQGFLTRQVTDYLNLAGAFALLPLAWDTVAFREPAPWRRRLRRLCWIGMAGTLLLQARLHVQLDQLLGLDLARVLDRRQFRTAHRWYLWASTVQWACGVVYCGLTLAAWREEDSKNAGNKAIEPQSSEVR